MVGNTHGESPLRHIELGPLKTIDGPEATISPHLKYFTGEMRFGDEVHVRAQDNKLAVAGTCQRLSVQGCKCRFEQLVPELLYNGDSRNIRTIVITGLTLISREGHSHLECLSVRVNVLL